MRRFAMTFLAAILMLAAPASAAVIVFETAPVGPGFIGPASEAGFIYETGFGALAITAGGVPGHALAGDATGGGGVLLVRRSDGGLFRFTGIDAAAYDASGFGTQDLIVAGISEDFIQFDTFSLVAGAAYSWSSYSADVLHDLPLTALFIILGAGSEPSTYAAAIDNLRVTPEIPEPAGILLLAGGMVVVGAFRRRI